MSLSGQTKPKSELRGCRWETGEHDLPPGICCWLEVRHHRKTDERQNRKHRKTYRSRYPSLGGYRQEKNWESTAYADIWIFEMR